MPRAGVEAPLIIDAGDGGKRSRPCFDMPSVEAGVRGVVLGDACFGSGFRSQLKQSPRGAAPFARRVALRACEWCAAYGPQRFLLAHTSRILVP